MGISRRALLATLIGSPFAPTLAHASGFAPPSCQAAQSTQRLVVDIHCHLLNARDVDRSAFVKRRVLELDENWSLAKGVVSSVAQVAYPVAYANSQSMAREIEFIARNQNAWVKNPEKFCKPGPGNRSKVFGTQYEYATDGSAKPLAGMMNGRLANAVRMMHEFPNVDLFTPSMVDFYEGSEDWYSENFTMTVLYERISQATFGRALPIVGFNPQRQVDYRHREEERTPLGLVKKAIKDRNFVGVKLHPSVGFGPLNNAAVSCPNSAKNKKIQISEYRKRYGNLLDAALWELFEYCADNDVPIITHGSPGIAAYAQCMKPGDVSPKEWLYAPAQWTKVLDQMKRRNPEKPLRICLGHFAGAFSSHIYWRPWMESLLQSMNDHPTLYADLSIQSGLFDGNSERRGKLRAVFRKLFEDNEVLSNQSIYGTDWHMAEVAAIGSKYLTEMMEMIPSGATDRVFGGNAIEYLGLKTGRQNRTRIESYLSWLEGKGRVPVGYRPEWMRKVDALP